MVSLSSAGVLTAFGARVQHSGIVLLKQRRVADGVTSRCSQQVLLTSPSVSYRAHKRDGSVIEVESSSQFPALHELSYAEEPKVMGTLIFPGEYVGAMLSLCESHRGIQKVKGYFYSWLSSGEGFMGGLS